MRLRHRLTAASVIFLVLAAPILAQQRPLRTPGEIRGVLLDAEGLPAEGHQVGARSAAGDLFLSPRTGRDGAFVLTGLPPGEYRLVAFTPDGAELPLSPGDVKLGPGKTARLELRVSGEAGPPGRTADDVGRVRAGTRSGQGSFWTTRSGRIVLIGGGIVAAALIYSAVDDDETRAVSPATP